MPTTHPNRSSVRVQHAVECVGALPVLGSISSMAEKSNVFSRFMPRSVVSVTTDRVSPTGASIIVTFNYWYRQCVLEAKAWFGSICHAIKLDHYFDFALLDRYTNTMCTLDV